MTKRGLEPLQEPSSVIGSMGCIILHPKALFVTSTDHETFTLLNIYIYTLGVKDYKKNDLTRGTESGNFLYSSQSKYSLWTSRAYVNNIPTLTLP